MSGNKVEFGLKNVHYALFEEVDGVIVYDTPVRIPGAVSLTLTPRGDMAEFYADNMIYYAAASNDGYDGSLSIAKIPEQYAIDVLDEKKDIEDGVLTEKADARPKSHALLFEFEGDVKATRHVLYNCSANRPTVTGATTTNTKEPQPNELTFVSSPRATDYAVKTKTTATTTPEVYDAWYEKVYEKTLTP